MSPEGSIPRAGLIGISGYGRIYLQLVLQSHRQGELRLVAAVVINPQEEAGSVRELESIGCAIYGDYTAMLDAHRGALELCLIPTGIAWHTRMTVSALLAGANVLVEKPLACSLAEVSEIEKTSARVGRFVAVGFQDFYEPATFWLKERLVDGAIGELQTVRFLGQWPRPRAYFTRNNWAGRIAVDSVPVLDSPLSNAFAHFVNLSLFFAARRREESARARVESVELFRAHEIENFDTAVVRLRTEADVTLWFGATHACETNREPEIIVTGTRGRACWRHEKDVSIETTDQGLQHRRIGDAWAARDAMMHAVLQRLRGASVVICGPSVAARHTAVIEEIARLGVIKTVPPQLIAWQSNDGPAAAVPVVAGLEPAMQQAYQTGSTLAAAGFRIESENTSPSPAEPDVRR